MSRSMGAEFGKKKKKKKKYPGAEARSRRKAWEAVTSKAVGPPKSAAKPKTNKTKFQLEVARALKINRRNDLKRANRNKV